MNNFALVLDMDGVVIDSNPLHAEVWEWYLTQHGFSADSMMEHMHGKRNDEIVRAIFGPGLSDEEVFAHGARKEARYRELMRPQIASRLIPGVVDFLERHRRLPIAIATNAEPANLELVLNDANLGRYFQVAVDGHQVKHPKPYPDIYLLVARRLGVEPSQCIVFEDSPSGIRAARDAGTRVVAVRTSDAALPPTGFSISDFKDSTLEPWLLSLGV